MSSSIINRSEFVCNLESFIDLENLNKEGIDYWPIVKLLLFTFERKPIRIGFSKISYSILSRIKSSFDHFKPKPKINLFSESVDLLFFSANTYRENIFGKSYNKFFNKAIEYFKNSNFLVLEIDYSIPSSKLPYENFNGLFFVNRFPKKYKCNSIIQYSNYEYSFLERFATFLNVDLSIFLEILTLEIQTVISWKFYYLEILKKLKPKYIIISCYYSIPMFGLVAAAHELGILTLDFQHGGQGKAHPCYYYSRCVTKKLNTMPNNFGVWDNKSYNLVNNWGRDFHKVFLIDNPWHSFIKEKYHSFEFKEKFILFTLTLERINMLPNYILETVRNTREIWYFRFHPRTSEVDKIWVKNMIKRLGIKNVKFDVSNELPLPILLMNCKALVSQSSGSISEAISLNVSNIIVTDELGHNFYKDEIDSNIVVKFDSKKDVLSDLLSIKSNKLKKSVDSISLIEHINSTLLSLE